MDDVCLHAIDNVLLYEGVAVYDEALAYERLLVCADAACLLAAVCCAALPCWTLGLYELWS